MPENPTKYLPTAAARVAHPDKKLQADSGKGGHSVEIHGHKIRAGLTQ